MQQAILLEDSQKAFSKAGMKIALTHFLVLVEIFSIIFGAETGPMIMNGVDRIGVSGVS